EHPPARQAERPADERAVGASVRDDRDRPAGVGADDRFEGGPRSGLEIRDALAFGEGKLPDVRHPLGELLRLRRLDLRGGQALPATHRHLAERGHDSRCQPVRATDDLAGSPGTDQIAREDRGQLHRREAGGLRDALTEEIDQRSRCDQAETVRRPASSASSIAAPSTSPVIPETRATKNRVTISALATATITTTIPSARSATMATTSAMDSAIGAARAPTPAPNAAPRPSRRAGGNRRASKGGVARATAGTTRSARAWTPDGNSVSAAISRSRRRISPSAPKAPIRLSRMMASRCSGSRPPRPSGQSASPLR